MVQTTKDGGDSKHSIRSSLDSAFSVSHIERRLYDGCMPRNDRTWEVSSLHAVAEALLGREIDLRRVDTRFEELSRSLSVAQRSDVSRALRVLEGRTLGLLTGTGWRRFGTLEPSVRQQRLHALRRSRLKSLRHLYMALHRLSATLCYGDVELFGDDFYPGPPSLPERRS